jgi:hypothetical protein
VALVAGRDVRVSGVAGQPVQADGDIVTRLPLNVSVDPEPVMLVWPR